MISPSLPGLPLSRLTLLLLLGLRRLGLRLVAHGRVALGDRLLGNLLLFDGLILLIFHVILLRMGMIARNPDRLH